jgi:hypothetical protein
MFCFVYRLLISHAEDQDRPVGPSVQNHCSGCPACRHYFNETRALARGLRQPEVIDDSARATEFNQRILSTLDRRHNDPAPSLVAPRIFRTPAVAAATVGLLIAVGSLLYISHRHNDSIAPETLSRMQQDIQAFILPGGSPLPGAMAWQQPDDWSQWVETPMSRELDHIIGDATAAADALLTCLSLGYAQTTSANSDDSSG